jgi:hypothetical protein
MDAQLTQLVELSKQLEEEEAAVKRTKSLIKELEEQLIPTFVKMGMQRARIAGRTVWLDRKVRASAGGDMEALCNTFAMCKDKTLRSMVKETVNGNTLGAWVREFDPDNVLSPEQITALLPEDVRDVIKVTETTNLRVRVSE